MRWATGKVSSVVIRILVHVYIVYSVSESRVVHMFVYSVSESVDVHLPSQMVADRMQLC